MFVVNFFLTNPQLLAQIRLYASFDESYARRVIRHHASAGISEADIDRFYKLRKETVCEAACRPDSQTIMKNPKAFGPRGFFTLGLCSRSTHRSSIRRPHEYQ